MSAAASALALVLLLQLQAVAASNDAGDGVAGHHKIATHLQQNTNKGGIDMHSLVLHLEAEARFPVSLSCLSPSPRSSFFI